ncbi:MAG: acylphosphatase, partial [Aigarchaeota archaeon]|nr:acylphosphatase [Aigarchaeota archaeon]
MLTRARVHVRGVVQGVGFRPFVYRLAQDMGLKGYIRNTVTGVTIEVEGPEDSVKQFPARLRNEKPPLAAVEEIQLEMMKPAGYRSFEIFVSKEEPGPVSFVSPDVATCDQCLAETLDSRDRRYRYPFTNCTNCGPRFTIIEGMPYDRPRKSM